MVNAVEPKLLTERMKANKKYRVGDLGPQALDASCADTAIAVGFPNFAISTVGHVRVDREVG